MLIATKQHTAGNKTRYRIDYRDWLSAGRTLNASTGFSATMLTPAPADVMVNNASVTEDDLYFWVAGGALNEAFTVEVQVTDTLGEIVIDTINFTVVQP